MIDAIRSLVAIIYNLPDHATVPLSPIRSAGHASDYEASIAAVLTLVSLALWFINYQMLRSHLLTKQQLESNRSYKLYEQNRLKKKIVIQPWKRDLLDFGVKTFSAAGLYWLASSKNTVLVWSAAAIALSFLLLLVKIVLHEILHPDSTFNRRYLLFQKNPRFIRMRSLFEILRKTLYFVTAFAFISYSFHRLYPGAFSISGSRVSLFQLHFDSAMSMTCPATDPISYTTDLGSAFHIARCVCCFSIIFLFANLLLSSFSLADFKNLKQRKTLLNSAPVEKDVQTKKDLEELVESIAAYCIDGAEKRISLDVNLTKHLHADLMEIAELQRLLELVLERSLSEEESEKFRSASTMREIIDLWWLHIQKHKNEPMFPSIAKHLKNVASAKQPVKASSGKPDDAEHCGGS